MVVPESVVSDASVVLVTMTIAEQTYFESVSSPDVDFFELVLSARAASVSEDSTVDDADVVEAISVSYLVTPSLDTCTYGRWLRQSQRESRSWSP